MKSENDIKKFYKKADVRTSSEIDKTVLDRLVGTYEKANPAKAVQNTGRCIMKKATLRLTIAAAVIFAFAMLTMLVLNSQKNPRIKIPAELAAMSAEELIELNINPQDSKFSSEVIEAALKQALDNLAPLEVIELAKKFTDVSPREREEFRASAQIALIDGIGGRVPFEDIVTANISDYNWKPMIDFLEGKDRYNIPETPNLFINARLLDIDINVDDIKNALIERRSKRFFIEDMIPDDRYRATITLEVLDTTPKDIIKKGRKISIPNLVTKGQLDKFKIGSQYYVAMLHGEKGLEFLPYLKGFFEINPADETDLFPTRFWVFLCDAQDIIHFGNTPKQDAIAYWTGLLNSEAYDMAMAYMRVLPEELVPYEAIRDTITERFLNEENITLAFKYIDILPDEYIPVDTIMDIFESKYNSLVPLAQQITDVNPYSFPRIAKLREISSNLPDIITLLNLLLRVDDKDSIKQIYSLLTRDIQLGYKAILWESPGYRDTKREKLLFQLLIAMEGDNLRENFIELFQRYKNDLLLSGTYKSQANYTGDLLAEIHDKAGNSLDENFYAMLLELATEPSANGIENADSLKAFWKEIISSGYYDMRPYLEEFIKNPNLSDIGVEFTPEQAAKPDYAQFSYEQAAFEMLRELPADEQPTRKELIGMLLKICEKYNDLDIYDEFVYSTLSDILQKNDTECIPILTKLIIANKPYPSIKTMVAERMPDPAFIPIAEKQLEKKYDDESAVLLFACGKKENAISIVIQNDRDLYPLYKLFDQLFKSGEQEKAIQIAFENNRLNSSLLELYYESGEQNRAIEIGISLLEKPVYDLRLFTTVIQLFGKSGRKDLAPLVERYTNEEVLNNLSQEIESSQDRPRYLYGSIGELEENAIMALAKLGGEDAIPRLRQIYETNTDIYMRHIAAISLYYLGDDIGWEILEPLIDGTYKEKSQLAPLLGIEFDIRNILQNPITRGMLGNERTYALLIKKMRNYIDGNDGAAFIDYVDNQSVTTQFFKECKNQVMPILVDYLSSSSKSTRSEAIGHLRKITNQDFGFNSDLDNGQEQVIRQWREYIEREY